MLTHSVLLVNLVMPEINEVHNVVVLERERERGGQAVRKRRIKCSRLVPSTKNIPPKANGRENLKAETGEAGNEEGEAGNETGEAGNETGEAGNEKWEVGNETGEAGNEK